MPDQAVSTQIRLEVERKGDLTLVMCHGRLVSGATGPFYAQVHDLISGSKRIVLDLSHVEYMDSMGLGTLVRLMVSCKSAGCSLELVNLGKRIKELLGVTHLLSVFTIIGEQGVRIGF
jgi:anti-anti-sigma factor